MAPPKWVPLKTFLKILDTCAEGYEAKETTHQEGSLIVVPAEAFSEAAVVLPFPLEVSPSSTSVAPGSSAERMFEKWGITIRGDGTVPIVEYSSAGLLTPEPPNHLWSIINEGVPNAGHPLTIEFARPARRVVLGLPKVREGSLVSAYDSNGQLLGTVDAGVLTASYMLAVGNGLESTGPHGISKLVIDYGQEEESEECSSTDRFSWSG